MGEKRKKERKKIGGYNIVQNIGKRQKWKDKEKDIPEKKENKNRMYIQIN